MRGRPDSLRARRTRSRGRGAEKSADVRVQNFVLHDCSVNRSAKKTRRCRRETPTYTSSTTPLHLSRRRRHDFPFLLPDDPIPRHPRLSLTPTVSTAQRVTNRRRSLRHTLKPTRPWESRAYPRNLMTSKNLDPRRRHRRLPFAAAAGREQWRAAFTPVSNRLYMTWVMRPRVEWRVGVKS